MLVRKKGILGILEQVLMAFFFLFFFLTNTFWLFNSIGYLDTYHEGYKHLILMLVMDKGSS